MLIIVLCLLAVTGANCELPEPHPDIQRVPPNGIVEVHLGNEEDITVLICEPSNDLEPASSSFSWYKVREGQEVEVTNAVSSGITVNGGELSIRVDNLDNGDRYRCKLDDEKSGDFEVLDLDVPVGKPFTGLLFRVDKFLRSYSVVENEDLKINCFVMNRTAEGFDMSEIALRWYMWETVDDLSFEATAGNCSIDSMAGTKWTEINEREDKEEPHIKFISRDGLSKAILKIEDAVKSDRRGFKCVAYNVSESSDESAESCSEAVAFVRVKDKYAALWPFLGIVAEVVVLLTVILIAEKRRANKEALEEEEEEDGVAGGPGSNPNSDKNTVRQRRQ